ncbi:MAG: rhodanese-like domain-containing protein [Gaiella sp.]
MLERASRVVKRLTPPEARAAVDRGAVLVDIRSVDARARDGVVPGSVHVPLTVLQWRLEPGGAYATPHVDPRRAVVLLCDHGCSSLLAAASLVELGLDAADVIGGIQAWREAGLPLEPATDAPLAPGELAGMRPPA